MNFDAIKAALVGLSPAHLDLVKAAILVSAAYTLWVDVARASTPDFIVLLRFRGEIVSAMFLLVFIDALSELLPPCSQEPDRSSMSDAPPAHPLEGTSASRPLE